MGCLTQQPPDLPGHLIGGRSWKAAMARLYPFQQISIEIKIKLVVLKENKYIVEMMMLTRGQKNYA